MFIPAFSSLLRGFIALSLFVLGLCVTASADKIVDIYTADVLVINQTAQVRNQAAVNELAKVFVRMSGSREVLRNLAVRNAISNAGRYVDEFSYQSTDEEITLLGTVYPASLLSLKFTSTPLESLLRAQQLPFWPTNRPEVLVWMAERTDRQRYVEKDSIMGQALDKAAAARGLPTITPVLDLQDRTDLPVAKIWVSDERSILQAAERYNVDAVVSGRVRQEANNFVADVILNHQEQTQYLQATADNRQALSEEIMAQVARLFAKIYAITGNNGSDNQDRFQLLVDNADRFSIYAKVVQYLQQVKLLEEVQLVSAEGQVLTFDIRFNGNIPQLQQTFALDEKLVFLEQRTVYETVVATVSDKPLERDDELASSPGSQYEPSLTITDEPTTVSLDDELVESQSTPLPPIQEDRAIQQLVFYWQ